MILVLLLAESNTQCLARAFRSLRMLLGSGISIFLLCLSPALLACPPSHPAESLLASWKQGCSHPLCGSIYEVSNKASLSNFPASSSFTSHCRESSVQLDKIQKAASQGSVLLLGEIHDNSEHHKFRAHFVGAPVVVLEQFDLDQQTELDSFYKNINTIPPTERRRTFERELSWEKSPWSQYNYAPLWDKILGSGNIKIRAGDAPISLMRKTAKYGSAALTSQTLDRLALNIPFEHSLIKTLRSDIKEAHCGLLPDTVLGNMAFAQRFRDATLTDVTLEALKSYGSSIVLAGNDHIRLDRGIPWYLRKRTQSYKIVSVMLMEVKDDLVKVEDYGLTDENQTPLADYFVFTPHAQREDPCKDFENKFKSAK